ncbi:MAG: PP2C family protein-serine/threonine phosphatase, partial [bacterium]
YMVRNEEIYLLSEDHSAVMELVKRGIISKEEARNHEDRNVIQKALGTHKKLDLSTWNNPLPIQADDQFVLCSDGLYDLVEDDEIKEIVLANVPSTACEKLIAQANERGGYDNITAGVINITPAETNQNQTVQDTRILEAHDL